MIFYYLFVNVFDWCVSGDLPYDKQIALLRRFYFSADWDEWFHLRDETANTSFLQVSLRFVPHIISQMH